MGKNYTVGEEDAGGLMLTINGTPIPLLPRVEAMVRLIIAHQQDIEQHPSSHVALDYAPWQVAFSLTVKSDLCKIARAGTEDGRRTEETIHRR